MNNALHAILQISVKKNLMGNFTENAFAKMAIMMMVNINCAKNSALSFGN